MLLSCTSAPPPHPISVKGKWKTADAPPMAYLSVDLADSTVVFAVLGDTIFRFAYHIDRKAQAVVLTDLRQRTVSCRVLKATADSLVFANLWDLPTPQRFVKE